MIDNKVMIILLLLLLVLIEGIELDNWDDHDDHYSGDDDTFDIKHDDFEDNTFNIDMHPIISLPEPDNFNNYDNNIGGGGIGSLPFEVDTITCSWSSSDTINYDLSSLSVTDDEASYEYEVVDDINGYSYTWNVCGHVPDNSKPRECFGRSGAAIRYNRNGVCDIIGMYQKYNDQDTYALIDATNPAIGVTLNYGKGDWCDIFTQRSTQVDIYCKNIYSNVVSASEPRDCFSHIVMESYYGCPDSCLKTSQGLCNGVGTCEYDSTLQDAYCLCDTGYSGDDCTDSGYLGQSMHYISTYTGTVHSKNKKEKNNNDKWALIILIAIFVLNFLAVGVLLGWKFIPYCNRRRQGYSALPNKEDIVMAEVVI
jgi:hypothetical protein